MNTHSRREGSGEPAFEMPNASLMSLASIFSGHKCWGYGYSQKGKEQIDQSYLTNLTQHGLLKLLEEYPKHGGVRYLFLVGQFSLLCSLSAPSDCGFAEQMPLDGDFPNH